MGFVMPAVRILDNVQIDANTYVIKIKEVDAGTGRIWAERSSWSWTRPAVRSTIPVPTPPSRLSDCLRPRWMRRSRKKPRSRAIPWSIPRQCCPRTLTELLKSNMSDLLSYGEVQKLLKDLPKEQGELAQGYRAEPDHRVRHPARSAAAAGRNASRSAICPPSSKGIADALAFSRNPSTLAEHVRARLARQICAQNTSMNGYSAADRALSAKWEQAFAESLIGTGEERSLAMQPSRSCRNS